MEKISWTFRVRNEQVLQRVKDETVILYTTKRRGTNRINHILRMNCLLNHVTSGNMEVTRGQGGICRQLLSTLKLKCKDESERGITVPLFLEIWRTRCGTDNGPVARQTKQQTTSHTMCRTCLTNMCCQLCKYFTHFTTTRS